MKAARLAIAIAVALLLVGSIFRVQNGDHVILSQFGEPYGNPITAPGLHFRIPLLQRVHHFRPSTAEVSYANSLVLTPLYPLYVVDSEEKFRAEADELKRRIGSARYVMLGFAIFLHLSFPDTAPSQAYVDTIVQRAKTNGLVAHISLVSGFFHGWNDLREQAIREDVRNAQWFADGLIAPAADLNDAGTIPRSVWITPSRYALPLRSTIEKGVRAVGAHLAHNMARSPETLVTVSGDGEVEYTYERVFTPGAEKLTGQKEVVYTDYSPFMIAEFRDVLKKGYAGDSSPATDENADGRTFNRDFRTNFATWALKYFDHSGPIPFSQYLQLPEKLPSSGPNFIADGFDAPREIKAGDPFWESWSQFREDALTHWVRDFATWITTSPDPETGFAIPASRYYTHQIPADFLFGQPQNIRRQTSASVVKTAMIDPVASSGVTAFNTFDGNKYAKTAVPSLFSALLRSADHWGVLEYNPSIPQSENENYYLGELRQLYLYRPHLIVPFAWSDSPEMKRYSIKDSAFERSLRRFVAEVGESPWFSLRPLAGP